MEKIVRMAVREGSRYVIFDNVVAGTDWTPEVLLSATSGSGRVLSRNMGTFTSFAGKTQAFFSVNGVHLDIRADVTGRMFLVRLAAPKAWQEITFHRTKLELLELATSMHPQVVWGAAVLLRSWKQAGEPEFRLASGNLSEFPEWLRVVGGVLKHAGWTDVLANQGGMQREENTADAEGADLLAALYAVFGEEPFTAGTVTKRLMLEGADRKSGSGSAADLLNFAPDEVVRAAVSGTLTTVRVGYWLKPYLDTRFVGATRYLRRSEQRIGNSREFVLELIIPQDSLS